MNRTYTIERARQVASNKQRAETNTAGWWKIRAEKNGRYSVYYDSAKTRDGVEDDEHAAI